MAADWDKTKQKIEAEIKKLIKSPRAVDELLEPDPTPYTHRPNILIEFPGFFAWLTDFADDQIDILENDLKQLRKVIERYQSRKRMYDGWVGKNLDMIHDKRTGKAVFREIEASTKEVTISPYHRASRCDYNALEMPHGRNATANATSVGMPINDSKGKPTGGSGTGKGSDALISFTPGMWSAFETDIGTRRSAFAKCSRRTGPGTKPDEVLLHELVHACRDMRGLSHLLGVTAGFDNEEEFIAVVVTNVYLSEKTKQAQLRASHRFSAVMTKPEKFLDDARIQPHPRVLMQRFKLKQISLFNSLLMIRPDRAWHNPFRQFALESVQHVHVVYR